MITWPLRGVHSIVFVPALTYLKNNESKLYKNLYACCLWTWLGSLPLVLQYASAFMDNITFLYQGVSGQNQA